MPTVNPNSLLFSSKTSKEAQAYKNSVTLSRKGREAAMAIAYSDGTVYNTPGKGAILKVEQSADQLEFVEFLFALLMHVSWQAKPRVRYELAKDANGKTLQEQIVGADGKPKTVGVKTSKPKSYEFRTWKTPELESVHSAIYVEKPRGGYEKIHVSGFVKDHITEFGFAIILIADGTLNQRDNVISLALNNLSLEGITQFNAEANAKFSLHRAVYPDRTKVRPQFFIRYPAKDRDVLRRIRQCYFLRCFQYKIVR